jgi:hypothetical protein
MSDTNLAVKPVTVAELIAHLSTLPQDLPVAYQLHSETCLLELHDIFIDKLQPARPDGWVHSARSDKPAIEYVVFPGN